MKRQTDAQVTEQQFLPLDRYKFSQCVMNTWQFSKRAVQNGPGQTSMPAGRYLLHESTVNQ